jgi:hypothetical protein
MLEQIASQGFDVLPDLIRTVVNADMRAERKQHLNNAAAYLHTPESQFFLSKSLIIFNGEPYAKIRCRPGPGHDQYALHSF